MLKNISKRFSLNLSKDKQEVLLSSILTKQVLVAVILTLSLVIVFLSSFYSQNMKTALLMVDMKNKEVGKNIVTNVSTSLSSISLHLAVLANSNQDENVFKSKDVSSRIMWEQLRGDSRIASIFMGDKAGNFLQARRTPALAIREIRMNDKNGTDSWAFKDANYTTILSKSLPADYDCRTRSWYKNASEGDKFYWTDPYVFASTGALGITVAIPSINKSNEKVKVVAADFTLESISKLLKEQSEIIKGDIVLFSANKDIISASFAYDVNTTAGKLITVEQLKTSKVKKAYSRILKGELNGEVLEDESGNDFIYSTSLFPNFFGKNWYIVSFVNKDMATIDARKSLYFAIVEILVMLILIGAGTLFWAAKNKKIQDELKIRTKEIEDLMDLQQVHINKLTRIATALSNEQDMPKLLEMILDGARELTDSDGGTLYLKSSDGKSLNFHVVKTASLNIAMGGTHGRITWPSLPLYLEDGSPNRTMVAALCAITGEVINIPDVYEADGFNFEGTKKFDAANNFRSKSMLVIPLKNHEQELIGVLQLINKIDNNISIPFEEEDQVTSLSLASQAAMAITNRILIKELEDLLMAFIKAIAKAIDAKSPYTGGHVRKVADIAVDLAKGINDDDDRFPDIKFSADELKQIHIAGLMHDIGKISTPVHIVDKSTKLEAIYDRIESVVLKCELLKYQQPENEQKINDDIEFLRNINKGGEFMDDMLIDRLKSIAEQRIVIGGVEQNLLTDNEIYNLSIKKGTLTKEDRDAIIGHAALSLNMLETLPFPKKLARIPEIAGNHHEQLNGRGYPRGLKAEDLSLESRIMAIADIFEALTASDRPYKDGKKLSECFKILSFMAKDNEIDPVLLKFYYDSELYMKYAKENLKENQIDEVKQLNI